jgi:glycosyltransferase involved in cell wall biosynthesis
MKDTNTPAISILLPTYNGARYLAEQLDSILAQTFGDFELLIIDDGSVDATAEIADGHAQRDRRIKIIPAEGNRGQKQRLVELIALARAPLIAISDQDDVWQARKLERLLATMNDAALTFGRSDLIDGAGNSLNRTLLDVLRAPRRCDDKLSLLFRAQVSGHAMLVRREFLSITAFDSPEPYDWLISLIAQFSTGIVYNDAAVVQHRLHGANAHNGGVLLRLNLLRIRPSDLTRSYQGLRAWRPRFVARLEYLAASPQVPEIERTLFQAVAHQCRGEWLEPRRGKDGGGFRLRRTILDSLRPLAGSARDWRVAVDHVTILTLGLLHPLTLIRLCQSKAIGR